MDLFITAELYKDVSSAFLHARTEVQDVLEVALAKRSFGPTIRHWYLIAIIMPASRGASYPETQEYQRGKKQIEFRLALDHAMFRRADPATRRGLLCGLLLRSVTLAEQMVPKGFDGARLRKEILATAAEHGWPVAAETEPGAAPPAT